ncbi:MAG: 50S ribosomal protein L11 methyltransferase [Defluviitaleaceae bacterium]|nr:50S ribosomal protein L11 methyltransferase [Defluviitaleaceae bacterium]
MNTLWTKVSIETKAENVDEVCAILIMRGIEGVEIVDPAENLRFLNEGESSTWDYACEDLLNQDTSSGKAFITTYLPHEDAEAIVAEAARALEGLAQVTSEVVKDDWSDAWLKYYKPFKIGNRIIIKPFWEEYAPDSDNEIVFTIDPGHVFGTGQHQSTALCIRLLEKYIQGEEQVLDIGCGSGILAIISSLLGAKAVTAVDIDPAAIKMANVNAELNNIGNLEAFCGNIIDDKEFAKEIAKNKYNIIVANIVADVIIKLAPAVYNMLEDGGRFIVGGIIDERASEVIESLESMGLIVFDTLIQDNWMAFCVQKMRKA